MAKVVTDVAGTVVSDTPDVMNSSTAALATTMISMSLQTKHALKIVS